MKLYEAIAHNARLLKLDESHWKESAGIRAERINTLLPRGSGFDMGTRLLTANDTKIVFLTNFHHMDENGFYDGWTEHRVTVTPSLMGGVAIRVTGRDKRGIKAYILDVFNSFLNEEFDWLNT